MIKPTEHYEELRQGLQGYKRDEDYLTLKDCVTHVLLDVRVWAHSHGLSSASLSHAYHRALEMEMCQIEQSMRVAKREFEAILEE